MYPAEGQNLVFGAGIRNHGGMGRQIPQGASARPARSDFYPKVAVAGNVGDATLDTSVADSAYFGGQHSVYGADVSVELPIFDGFERLKKLRIAEADLRSAESELANEMASRGRARRPKPPRE